MARVLLFHYREARTGKAMLKALQAAGHDVVDAAPDYPDFQPSVDIARPDVVVADCSHKAMNALEAASYVVGLAAYRGAAVVLANLPDSITGLVAAKVPGAMVVDEENIVDVVERASPS